MAVSFKDIRTRRDETARRREPPRKALFVERFEGFEMSEKIVLSG